jgi:hypothetical protein
LAGVSARACPCAEQDMKASRAQGAIRRRRPTLPMDALAFIRFARGLSMANK